MKYFKVLIIISLLIIIPFLVFSSFQANTEKIVDEETLPTAIVEDEILTGADQVAIYLPYLRDKKVGLLVNTSSIIESTSLVDSLLAHDINIKYIFGPEHGFRSNAGNGVSIKDEVDPTTGIPIISLYGGTRKPSKAQMDALDLIVFDIQDVGCRFFTYINKLYDIMEACAENNKELIILDRPNPNGFVDGPVLDMKLKSGIGKFPVPITHGMTMAEFAQMINGEGWLPNKAKCKLRIIPLKNYTHSTYYELPVSPSPNLNTQESIMLYPSLCLFEGTIISQGRGTYMPFTVLGNPKLKDAYKFSFTPKSIAGMSKSPLHMNETCYGIDLRDYDVKQLLETKQINLKWLMEFYEKYPDKARFFDRSQSAQMGDFDKLAGTVNLKKQIIDGMSEEEIRASWEPELSAYKTMRAKYVLYDE
ncbi:exo-beta-N-acetylmuramidase NamZ family protein [Kordia sp.]|uniref:exo-beta-N-acetylmuramidase NamZ family protein n=1 Tax=Kordia sp. TaxID=1965332 RepID=UPI003D2E43BC